MKIKINVPSINLLTKDSKGFFVGKTYTVNEIIDSSVLSEQEIIAYSNHFFEPTRNSGTLAWISIVDEPSDEKGVNFGLEQQPAFVPAQNTEAVATPISTDSTKK